MTYTVEKLPPEQRGKPHSICGQIAVQCRSGDSGSQSAWSPRGSSIASQPAARNHEERERERRGVNIASVATSDPPNKRCRNWRVVNDRRMYLPLRSLTHWTGLAEYVVWKVSLQSATLLQLALRRFGFGRTFRASILRLRISVRRVCTSLTILRFGAKNLERSPSVIPSTRFSPAAQIALRFKCSMQTSFY